MKTFLMVLMSAFSLCAQTDWNRWGKADFHYAKDYRASAGEMVSDGNFFSEYLVKPAVTLYRVGFSDLDGDNCPFSPTCSSFLVQSVKETNILQGTAMFFDRFTRDMNIFERHVHYPVIVNSRYYDPVGLYTLNEKKTRESVEKLYSSER